MQTTPEEPLEPAVVTLGSAAATSATEETPKSPSIHPNKANIGRPRRHKRIFRMTH